MSSESFLDGRVTLWAGDCLDVLARLGECSIDSVVCDPPYHLTSIVKRFGGDNAAPAKTYKTAPYGGNFKGSDAPGGGTGAAFARMSKGFMGKQWDGGDIAFRPETWAAVYRVLKPGGYLLAFSGTRTYHRMACAIEDAGFEVRDMVSWLYGSGFPKSHDVSKAIDKRKDWSALPRLQEAIKAARVAVGISQSEAARRMGLIAPDESLGGGGFMWFETGMRAPTREQWPRLKAALRIGDDFDLCFEEAEREVTGLVEEWTDRSNYAITSKDGFRRDKPASDLAAEWSGWGTALKPALEPICMARKPLVGTVAANVLEHGTGAINIDGCRVGAGTGEPKPEYTPNRKNEVYGDGMGGGAWANTSGRWPANVIHDGSEEVTAAFPDVQGAVSNGRKGVQGLYEDGIGTAEQTPGYGDSGSAARFFYSAKADSNDRIGSKHPTVKPVDLMQYLVRLVTPKGGTVLDPFSGTGTTGEAAWREGMRAVLIEREAEYQADIRRRMALCLAGPDERVRESIKAKTKDKPVDAGPLFSGVA